jgi:DNA-binding response OmpR family regulator
VSTVSSISDAWSAITAGGFDIVLVDYDLDDGKGDELVRRIRSHSLPVRVVGVSSRDDGNAAIQQAGADAICSKMEFSDIGSVLRRLVPA